MIMMMHTAKLFKNGNSQAIRLPKEFRLPGKVVKIKRQGKGLFIEPVEESFKPLFDALELFSSDFMQERREQLPFQGREKLF